MPDKTDTEKDSKKIDKIGSISEQVDEKEKVISVRIPSKSKSTDTKSSKEPEPKVEEKEKVATKDEKSEDIKDPKLEEKEPEKAEEKKEEPKKETTTKPISSFSMLDSKDKISTEDKADYADKESETKPESNESEYKDTESEPKDSLGKDPTTEIKKWLDEDSADSGESATPKKSKLKPFIIIVLIVAILGVVGGGIYFYQTKVATTPEKKADSSEKVTLPTATPKPTETPEDPLKQIDPSQFGLQIQNGSGVTGSAGEVASLFDDAGFASTDATNADSSNYTDTVVKIKDSAPDALYEAIKEVIKDKYVVTKSDKDLDESSTYDAVIILGSSKPEASPTPTEKAGI